MNNHFKITEEHEFLKEGIIVKFDPEEHRIIPAEGYKWSFSPENVDEWLQMKWMEPVNTTKYTEEDVVEFFYNKVYLDFGGPGIKLTPKITKGLIRDLLRNWTR